jgi:cytoskeleton protein RodZ
VPAVELPATPELPKAVASAMLAPAPTPLAPVAAAEPMSNEGLVVLTAKSASWVEVIDASGTVQLRKTLAAGEAVGASGGLPLVVTVGRADATDVQVRGKSFDLAPITKNNVARFEVR